MHGVFEPPSGSYQLMPSAPACDGEASCGSEEMLYTHGHEAVWQHGFSPHGARIKSFRQDHPARHAVLCSFPGLGPRCVCVLAGSSCLKVSFRTSPSSTP